jgi:hypothetical protein
VNGLAFASSLVTSALWPLVVVVAILVFRKPLAGLIGRTRRYEGLGQKLEFGVALAEAEDSVGRVLQDTPVADKQPELEPSPLVEDAETNPSYVVLRSWEQLSEAIASLAEAALPDQRVRSWNASRFLPQLQKREFLDDDYVSAATELRHLRNKVAHGESSPTPGEALAYADSARVLAIIAARVARVLAMSLAEDD